MLKAHFWVIHCVGQIVCVHLLTLNWSLTFGICGLAKILPLFDLAACPGWMLGLASSVNAEEIMICRVLWLDSIFGLTSLEVGLVSTCLSIIVGLTLAGW